MTLAATLPDAGFLELPPTRLEYRMIGPRPDAAPTIVMLHEGLGCVGLWRAFPEQLAAATGAGVFLYSRAGYGQSSPASQPRSVNFMDDEALDVLPRVLEAIGFQRGILFGHSDGASIATIYAGGIQDHRVRGLVLMAPHFFTEPTGLAAIRRTRDEFAAGVLREKLTRWHADVDGAFRSWVGLGSIRTLRSGTSPKRSVTSAFRSWSCRALTTSTARSDRSRQSGKSATAR